MKGIAARPHHPLSALALLRAERRPLVLLAALLLLAQGLLTEALLAQTQAGPAQAGPAGALCSAAIAGTAAPDSGLPGSDRPCPCCAVCTRHVTAALPARAASFMPATRAAPCRILVAPGRQSRALAREANAIRGPPRPAQA